MASYPWPEMVTCRRGIPIPLSAPPTLRLRAPSRISEIPDSPRLVPQKHKGVQMTRIRWGNVAIATVVLLLVGYAGLWLFGLAPLPGAQTDTDVHVVQAPTLVPV